MTTSLHSLTKRQSKSAVAEWTIPRQITENYTASMYFIKNLTILAVSTMTYYKKAIPEENYSAKKFASVNVMVLKTECQDELAQFLSKALTQAFDAFDKKYLHQMALCFYDDECKPENLMEYHVFEYSYNDEDTAMIIKSKSREQPATSSKYTLENIEQRTVQMVRACMVTQQGTPKWTDRSDISLRLYYNKDTPEWYQAPGFQSVDCDSDYVSETLKDAHKLGSVATLYHAMVLKTYQNYLDSSTASRAGNASPNQPVMTQLPDEFLGNAPVILHLTCACNMRGDDEHSALVTCAYCKDQQHATCYGLRGGSAARAVRHCCVACSDADPSREPTDRILARSNIANRECLAIFRLTLEYCTRVSSLSASDLSNKFGMTQHSVRKLMKLLQNYGIIKESPLQITTQVEIISERLESAIKGYFRTYEVDDVVDRIASAAIFASQESQHDPIGDVLSPSEITTLQNASNLGRIIENLPEDVNEDSTLNKYREAFVSCQRTDDELPLSGSHNPVRGIEKLGKNKKEKVEEKKVEKKIEEKKVNKKVEKKVGKKVPTARGNIKDLNSRE